jgi:tetratricopeptide (TPR) repeat protein
MMEAVAHVLFNPLPHTPKRVIFRKLSMEKQRQHTRYGRILAIALTSRLFLALLLAAATASAGVKESWYMMRGNSNMKIQNYNAAIEAYEKACEMNPDNREGMRLLGIAYDSQGLTDKAIQQYCRYLDRFGDDAEIAYKTGDLLQWSRYNYRKADAIKYYHKTAKLLAADKSTLDDAIREYSALMSRHPDDLQFRKEYRALLLWDEKYLGKAIDEYKTLAENNPANFEINHEYARLLARDKSARKEARGQYEELLRTHPSDNDLRLEYAKVLAADPAKFDQSRQELETVLAAGGGSAAREAYADLLAGKPSTRKEAGQEYRKVISGQPRTIAVRLKYAAILSEDKSSLPQAIEQYKIVIKQEPKNRDAHSGLAKAYAWIDDKERAIYHSGIAAQYGSAQANLLNKKLMLGREPYVGGDFNLIVQPGDWFGVTGFSLVARGRINPYDIKHSKRSSHGLLLIEAEAGGEHYSSGTKYLASASGLVIKANGEYHLTPDKSLYALIGYHTLPRLGDGFETLLRYTMKIDSISIRMGFRRDLVYESLFALAGHPDSAGTPLGSARASRFFGEVFAKYRIFEANIGAYLGWVSAQTAGSNPMLGVNLEPLLGIPLGDVNRRLCVSYYFDAEHFDRDFSGLEVSLNDTMPQPGGYFSPQAFVNHGPRIGFRNKREDVGDLQMSLGPSFQYSRELKAEKRGAGMFVHCRYFRMFANSISAVATFDYATGPRFSNFKVGTFVYRTF